MKRRKFILLSSMGAIAVSASSLRCTNVNPVLEKNLSLPDMLAHITDAKTIHEIGKVYGENNPDEYKSHKLEQLLMTGSQYNKIADNASPSDIQAQLTKNIKAEFIQNKTVVVKGWILSVTEARQCALYSLTSSKQ